MIVMNDFKAEPPELRDQELEAVERVLKSGWYVLGSEVQQFEQSWTEICGVRSCVGVGNGMDAIEIGLRVLDIGPGDEVITTPMTAFATVLAIIRAGATPVLADIDQATAILDPASVEQCLSSHTKAVLLVHLYGHIHGMERWIDLCDASGVHLLEDCAQAHLASWRHKTAGSFGSWGAYSFYPTKNLGAIGDGGALITNEEEIAQKARILRNYGQTERYHHSEVGLNSRLDEIQAALLQVRLNWLKEFTERRRYIAQIYFGNIYNPKIRLLDQPRFPENHSYHLFVIRCKEREQISNRLSENGIHNLMHYPVPIHLQKACHHLHLRQSSYGLTQAEQYANECLSIPCHPQMDDNDIARVIEVLNGY
jgi:dTDP-4-amino-4,6-dideoxygalactose transaminase